MTDQQVEIASPQDCPHNPPAMKMLVIGLLAALVVSCRKNAAPSAQPPSTTATITALNPASWMQDHLDTLGNVPLKQIAMPASHDSGMYLTGFPQSLGRTQELDIYHQLNQGVRYFDLRPKWSAGSLCLHHDIINGPRLDAVLGDVNKFMTEGHHELVILKFSHYDGMNQAQYETMAALIATELSPWLYRSKPEGKRLADISLHDYVSTSGTILVVCDGQFPVASHHDGIWVYRDWDSADPDTGDLRVYDQYSNTISFAAMKADQLSKFDQYDGRCKQKPQVPCDLFLLSWTLTPPTNVPAFAIEPNQKLVDSLKELHSPNRAGCRINLLYTDCVESAHLTEAAMALNESLH